MNDPVFLRDRFWEEANIDGYMNVKRLFKGIEKCTQGFRPDISDYLRVIQKYEGPIE